MGLSIQKAVLLTFVCLVFGGNAHAQTSPNERVVSLTHELAIETNPRKREHIAEQVVSTVEGCYSLQLTQNSVDGLFPLLRDKDIIVRLSAAESLGLVGIRAKQSLPLLKKLLNEEESWLAKQHFLASSNAVDILKEAISRIENPYTLPSMNCSSCLTLP